jgi:hypothetical protein
MSQNKEKNMRRLFKARVKDEIHELAEKKVDEHVEGIWAENKEYKKMVRIIARQRDICFIVAGGFLFMNFAFVLWWWLG